MEIQSANIIKFETGKVLLYPLRTIKDQGSYAVPPYMVKQDITYEEMAICLKEILKSSGIGLAPPRETENLFHKENIKVTGIKNTKMFHDKSLHVGVYTRDGKYHLSPSVNKGARRGFLGIKDARTTLSLDSSIDELAKALKEAFAKSS